MIKKIYILLIALLNISAAMGQSCLPEGIYFENQDQIDNFQFYYPNCTEIEGNVTISGNEITSLSGLSVLTSIGGYLEIVYNYSLNNLEGLENLTSIGGDLVLRCNAKLSSIDELGNIDPASIESIEITKNYALTNCAISNLCEYIVSPNGSFSVGNNGESCNSVVEFSMSCGGSMPCLPYGNYSFYCQKDIDDLQIAFPDCSQLKGGGVRISGNNIHNLYGLNNVSSIEHGLYITDNDSLIGLQGLDNLDCVEFNFYTINNPMISDFSGLENLDSVGYDIWISQNESLVSLQGLDSLNIIGNTLVVSFNSSLESLDGVDSLTNIKGLSIYSNDSLKDISALSDIIPGDLTNGITISGNKELSECGVPFLCNFMLNPIGPVNINDNKPGCNSVIELASACGGNMPCLPYGNYYFQTQSDIDSFQYAFNLCEELNEETIISGNDITNLDGINIVTRIKGDFEISNNPNLTDLSGLYNLSAIEGDFLIDNNDALNNLIGFSSLDSIFERFNIENNNMLNSLSGIEGVSWIGGFLYINNDSSLVSLSGLEGLQQLNGINISNNHLLPDLTGLGNISSLGVLGIGDNESLSDLSALGSINSLSRLSIRGEETGNPSLENLTGLDGISSTSLGVYIYDNVALKDLSGLNHLVEIGSNLHIYNNDALVDISALKNLESIGGTLNIMKNDALTKLTGLDNIAPGSITNLDIRENNNLSLCAITSVCLYLLDPNKWTHINNNTVGCNSIEEVLDSCEANAVNIPEELIAKKVSIYPNPTQSTITIELPTQPSKNTSLTISNTNGQQLITQPITEPQTEIDISHLPTGVYIVKVWNDKDLMVRKVIKQ